MKQTILIHCDPKELATIVKDAVRQAIDNLPLAESELPSDERLTRKQLKETYKISYTTIHSLMRSGKLRFQKVGRKTLFKKIDIEHLVNSISCNNDVV